MNIKPKKSYIETWATLEVRYNLCSRNWSSIWTVDSKQPTGCTRYSSVNDMQAGWSSVLNGLSHWQALNPPTSSGPYHEKPLGLKNKNNHKCKQWTPSQYCSILYLNLLYEIFTATVSYIRKIFFLVQCTKAYFS